LRTNSLNSTAANLFKQQKKQHNCQTVQTIIEQDG